MTVARSLAFAQDLRSAISDLAQEVDIILCQPYTALYPMAQALKDSPITLRGTERLYGSRWGSHRSDLGGSAG